MIHSRIFGRATLLACTAAISLRAAAAQQSDARSSMLVTPAWLAAHLHDANLVLLHVGTADDYAKAHIAGARLVSNTDIATPPPDATSNATSNARTLEMLPADELRALVDARNMVFYDSRSLGIKAVLYDGSFEDWRLRNWRVEVPPR
jgi:3-mercaptopyruvate sulfurtransferase SseA